MELQGRVGPATAADAAVDTIRLGRTLEQIVSDAHGRYHDAALNGRIFSLYFNATGTNIAAGQIELAAAAASTQFALWNPLGSPVALSILRFGIGTITTTTSPAGPVTHSMSWGNSITAASIGTVFNHKLGAGGTQAGYLVHITGSALTGGKALTTVMLANFTTSATAPASVSYINAIDEVNGALVLMPGALWVPTHVSQGSAHLSNYSVTWEEVPL